jgi:hypothetical protein
MAREHGPGTEGTVGTGAGETPNDADASSVDTIPGDDGEVPVASSTAQAGLGRARFVSDLLDDAIRIPGTNVRFGLDPVLGVVSGYGDAVAAALSLYPIFEAYRLGAPRRTLAKMLSLVAVDFALGSIPILGTVFDAFWKTNAWNVRTLERHVEGG